MPCRCCRLGQPGNSVRRQHTPLGAAGSAAVDRYRARSSAPSLLPADASESQPQQQHPWPAAPPGCGPQAPLPPPPQRCPEDGRRRRPSRDDVLGAHTVARWRLAVDSDSLSQVTVDSEAVVLTPTAVSEAPGDPAEHTAPRADYPSHAPLSDLLLLNWRGASSSAAPPHCSLRVTGVSPPPPSSLLPTAASESCARRPLRVLCPPPPPSLVPAAPFESCARRRLRVLCPPLPSSLVPAAASESLARRQDGRRRRPSRDTCLGPPGWHNRLEN